jgi:hypothetical protein
MNYSPIALFTYNRPEHTKLVLEALVNNPEANETKLFVFIDGPKKERQKEDLKNIHEIINIFKKEKRLKSIEIFTNEYNLGLASSIINGVSKILKDYESIIVLEDDLLVTKDFLHYMNRALDIYEFEHNVACISGYIYPVKEKLPDTFFLKGADCWGWATWKRAWDRFEQDGKTLLKQIDDRNLKIDFDFNNSYPYYQMLKDQIEKKNNSWAIRWYASAFLNNYYCLYPAKSYILNIGLDGSGTHSGSDNEFLNAKNFPNSNNLILDKINVKEDVNAKQIITKYFINNFSRNRTTIIVIFKKFILNLIKKLHNL